MCFSTVQRGHDCGQHVGNTYSNMLDFIRPGRAQNEEVGAGAGSAKILSSSEFHDTKSLLMSETPGNKSVSNVAIPFSSAVATIRASLKKGSTVARRWSITDEGASADT